MAKYFAGYLSPIKNKLGNAVGRRWRNIDVLAVYQPNVKNPRTTKQVAQRKRLSFTSSLARTLNPVIAVTLARVCAGTRTFPRAKFVALNIANTTSTGTIDHWQDVILSDGKMLNPSFAAATAGSSNDVTLSWTEASLSEILPDADVAACKVSLAILNPVKKQVVVSRPTAVSAESIRVVCPASWIGDACQCYAYTQCLGETDLIEGIQIGDFSRNAYVGQVSIA